MKAILFREHGSLDALDYVENFPVPELAPDEALIKVRYAALNRLDQFVVRGWKGLDLLLPHLERGQIQLLGESTPAEQYIVGWARLRSTPARHNQGRPG